MRVITVMQRIKLRELLVLSCIALLSACESDSSISQQSYACELPCLKSEPILSTATVSSATGGEVKVTYELDGDLTNIDSIFVFFEEVGGGSSYNIGPLWNPTQSLNTVSITVDAGTPVGEYYPRFSFRHVSPDNTGSQYYLDSTNSSSRYTYYEWVAGKSTPIMVSPYNIPRLTIQD